jgi:hypothetical protein
MSAPDIPAALKTPALVHAHLAGTCPNWGIAPGRVAYHVERIGFDAAWEAAEATAAQLWRQGILAGRPAVGMTHTGREVMTLFDALCSQVGAP